MIQCGTDMMAQPPQGAVKQHYEDHSVFACKDHTVHIMRTCQELVVSDLILASFQICMCCVNYYAMVIVIPTTEWQDSTNRPGTRLISAPFSIDWFTACWSLIIVCCWSPHFRCHVGLGDLYQIHLNVSFSVIFPNACVARIKVFMRVYLFGLVSFAPSVLCALCTFTTRTQTPSPSLCHSQQT